ncbi:MAG: LacI family DNA-binding transcriptional regulator, partial [Rubrobacter sp.]
LDGYRTALEDAGLAFDPTLVEGGYWQAEGAYEATMKLLDREPGITAVFAQNDTMALGVLSALGARGIGVPDDCAVVGCDDIPIAAHTIPPLTTVHVPFFETGETAVRLLLDLISGEENTRRRVLLPVRLVRRASCGAGAELASGNAVSGEE